MAKKTRGQIRQEKKERAAMELGEVLNHPVAENIIFALGVLAVLGIILGVVFE